MHFDIFLSHNSNDKPAVRDLKALLVANGLSAWLDEDELQPGIPWQQLLEKGIKNSKSVAVLVGKDGFGPWEDEEMQGALVLAVKDKRPCIPVLLPGAAAQPELPMFLGNRTWVDLRSGYNDDGLARLIWGITGKKPERIARRDPAASGRAIVAPTRLHHGADHLFGRDKELADLDQFANDPTRKILTVVAFGGVGKTSLVIEWMARQAARNWKDWDQVFDWSFFSQGTREQGGASAEGFVAEALRFFGDEAIAQSAASPWDKGARLAQLVAQRRTLLVLDGVEPLQHPPGPLAGELKDPALATLLKGLARSNSGLCIVTTRERVADLAAFRDTTAPEWQLHHLSIPAGVKLLKTLGVRGTAAEFQQLVERVRGHALTLNLLGRYLAKAHGGDIRKSDQVKFEKADAATQAGYAFKTIGAYERWLNEGGADGARQLAVLRLLGLFDRPAVMGCMASLRKEPVIANLTEPLVGLNEEDWNLTVSSLTDCGLAVVQSGESETPNSQFAIDAHPLIREYFAKRLREKADDAWRAAHQRLYEYLCDSTHEGDKPTLEDLQPLYQAVAHGCHAGLQQEALYQVYHARVLQRDENYSTQKLGAFGSDLGAVACFFELPWVRVSTELPANGQAWILSVASFNLRALGRLTEALEPLRAAIEVARKAVDEAKNPDILVYQLRQVAIRAGNLSELELTLGDVGGAERHAEQSVIYADRCGEWDQRMTKRTTHADALHHAGRRTEAEARFREAEAMQAEHQNGYSLLYSMQGFQYCDLLSTDAERAAWRTTLQLDTATASCGIVSQRATQAVKIAEHNHWPFDIALDHLTLARAALYEAITKGASLDHCNSLVEDAVDGLRRAGQQWFIPTGLLSHAWLRSMERDAQAAQTDLDEAWEIAERGPMKLFMADIHLYRARLFHAVKPYPWNKNPDGTERGPKDDLAAARKLIEQCGYLRRKEELEDAEEAAKGWV